MMVNKSISLLTSSQFSFEGLLKAGDQVICGQTCAEPLTLTRALVEHAARTAQAVDVFVGTLFSDTFDAAPASMRFKSYGAIGRAAKLADRGALEIYAERYSRLPGLFADGVIGADVALLQVALDDQGRPSFSLACDHLLDAARRARVVIAEVNPQAPWTYGTAWPDDLRVDAWVQADGPPLELAKPSMDEATRAIGRVVAALVPDGATVQVGVGSLPDACLEQMTGHAHLGLHSGVLGDAGVALIESGAIDNSRKLADPGISVTNTICGSSRAFRFVDRNQAVEVRHTHRTHGEKALGAVPRFHAINGALEVDLSGQVNSEEIQGQRRGGIGGVLDFARAARQSPGGRGIVVLPATAAGGRVSRIVATLSGPATIGRADVDTIVTEYGAAHLRDVPLAERARRLIAIAAPQFRDSLTRALQEKGRST